MYKKNQQRFMVYVSTYLFTQFEVLFVRSFLLSLNHLWRRTYFLLFFAAKHDLMRWSSYLGLIFELFCDTNYHWQCNFVFLDILFFLWYEYSSCCSFWVNWLARKSSKIFTSQFMFSLTTTIVIERKTD